MSAEVSRKLLEALYDKYLIILLLNAVLMFFSFLGGDFCEKRSALCCFGQLTCGTKLSSYRNPPGYDSGRTVFSVLNCLHTN